MKSHHVLVVEDDLEIREALVELLEENGCQALGMEDGARALVHLQQATSLPCLILLDLMMPVMDGYSFRAAQLADPRIANIPVVIVSAYRDLESRSASMKAASFIKKPPKEEELMSAIAQYC